MVRKYMLAWLSGIQGTRLPLETQLNLGGAYPATGAAADET